MKQFTILALVCVFALGACVPAPVSPNSAPAVDIAGTVNSISNTSIAQTFEAQPSATIAPVLDTATPPIAEASATSTAFVNTDTPQANLTTTPATATSGPADLITPSAVTTATPVSSGPTLTPTLGVLTYGTLPPANTPHTQITVINKAKRQAYLSLQVVTDQGYTIIEYPVQGIIKISIPTGSYTYVAWVGGRPFTGYFNVSKSDDLTITIFKDKLTINKGSASYP